MAKRSRAWDHFALYDDNDGRPRAQCKYCDKNYAADASINGTSALNNHMEICENHPDDVAGDETESFRNFFQYFMPSAKQIERDCLRLYGEEKEKLKVLLKGSGQGVSLTFDIWTSKEVGFPYMCLKAHFIDDEWKLQTKFLNFKGYDIEETGVTMEECLNQWDINRILTVTLDHSSASDPTVEYLRNKLVEKGTTVLGGKYLHMKCVSHVINIVMKNEMNRVSDSVERIRAVVRYVWGSSPWVKMFKHFVKEEKIKDTKKALRIDIPSQCRSVYLMLEGAVLFQSVFKKCEDSDASFRVDKLHGPDGEVGFPTEYDWVVVSRLVKVLQQLYDLTARVSCFRSVTSSDILEEISDAYSLVTEWMSSKDPVLVNMAKRIKMKFDKYWGDVEKMNMIIFVATMLDPRRKVTFVTFALNNICGEEIGCNITKLAEDSLSEMFDEYKKIFTSEILGSSSSSETELDKYVNENIDLLDWWEVHTTKYPILSRLARDVLAVPVSSVGKECVFGTKDFVIDDNRASMTPETMEAMICAQDWLCKKPDFSDEDENILDDEDEDNYDDDDSDNSSV